MAANSSIKKVFLDNLDDTESGNTTILTVKNRARLIWTFGLSPIQYWEGKAAQMSDNAFH